MSHFVETLIHTIQAELASKIGSSGDTHYRGVFYGPPEEILELILQATIKTGGLAIGESGNLISPILLPCRNVTDPIDLNTSGRCSESHLVRVRTSSKHTQFLILLPPGQHMNESMETTIQQMGISPSQARFAYRTQFYEQLLNRCFERTHHEANEYTQLARGVLRSELVNLDEESQDGTHQWGLLQRLFDFKVNGASEHDRALAIMGLVSCDTNQLEFNDHKKVLGRLADLLESTGIRQGFEVLKQRAEEELLIPLDQCMKHIRKQCHSGSDFKEACSTKYSPFLGTESEDGIPEWWSKLTLNVWLDLLDTRSVKQKKNLIVKCSNTLIPQGKGLPCIVQSAPVFEISYKDLDNQKPVKITRKVGRRAAEEMGDHDVSIEGTEWKDSTPPSHLSHLEYIFHEHCNEGDEEQQPIKIKVIALDSFEIGIIPYCRNAAKIIPFKATKKRKASKKSVKKSQTPLLKFESTLELHGMGMHQIDLYTSNGINFDKDMIGHDSNSGKEHDIKKPINASGNCHAVSLIDTDEDCYYVFKARLSGEKEHEYSINIVADNESPIGADSEFDRLVIQHQKKARNEHSGAVISMPSGRSSDLQRWILNSNNSYRPLIIGPDFEDHWAMPNWEDNATISAKDLLQDPRPSWEDMEAPKLFLELRSKLIKRIINDSDSGSHLLEETNLGDLMKDHEEDGFGTLVQSYISEYAKWLVENYEAAVWCDTVLACKADAGSGSLNPEPYAILLNPIHPLRLAWQCQAQKILKDALDEHQPCPAASTLDPNTFPDCMMLPVRQTSGDTKSLGFLAVGSSSDYWQILWNCNDFQDLASPEFKSLFGSWFGITIDGLASGFSSEQVQRSIDEMRRIHSAKSTLKLLVQSDSVGSSSCNEGIETWASANLGPFDRDNGHGDPWFEAGPTKVEVIDTREEQSLPLESQISRMAELSGGTLSWYSCREPEQMADLAVLAHLGTANPKLEKHKLSSAVGNLGLTRWRIRRQTGKSGKFIAETRVGKYTDGVNPLATAINESTFQLEQKFSEIGDAYVFAPNLPTLSKSLDNAKYCAVSSSTLDPACFFGQMDNFYLWDYDLPSYSRRAGENSGYYLLASESPAMNDSITAALAVLNPNSEANHSPDLIHSLLVEIANRGMPTLKRLTSGGSAALGEIGMLVALRILQGDFIKGQPTPGLVPVKAPNSNKLTLIIPVDPFAGHFDALRRSMGDRTHERPDLLIVSIDFQGSNDPCFIQLTPVEVKARNGVMHSSDRSEALKQASKFGKFLEDLWILGERYTIWGIAWKQLLCSWIDYGFRVYGQLEIFRHDPEWSICHQNVLASILEDKLPTAIDKRGRLVVIDKSTQSNLTDQNDDGHKETIVVTHADAHKIVTNPAASNISLIVEQLADWQTCGTAQLSAPRPEEKNPDSQVSKLTHTDEAKKSDIPPTSDDNLSIYPPRLEDGPSVASNKAEPNTTKITANAQTSETQPTPPLSRDPKARDGALQTDDGVRFQVGTSIGGITTRELDLHPSNTALNQLNIGVVGDLGTGKTQLLQALLYNLHQSDNENRGTRPNILIFDYKKDYSKPLFVDNTEARVIDPYDIPLNIFDTSDCTNQRNPWLERSRFFIDILSKIYSGIGPKQNQKIKSSIKEAYERANLNGKGTPTIYDVFEIYGEACGDAIDSPYSIMSDLVDQEIFVNSNEKTVPFKEFFKGVVVINLGKLGQDDNTKNMLVAIFLNLFYEHMLKVEKKPFLGADPSLRAIDSFLLVDEADNIMRYEFDVLRKILLQGREFGVGVILSSQYPSHFKTTHEKYAEAMRSWFIHKVPDISVKQLQSMGFTHVNEDTVERIKELECHECLYRSLGVEGSFMRGHPLFELMDKL